MDEKPDLRLFGTVFGPGGDHRLCLVYIALNDDGFDFHSLIWEHYQEGSWITHRTVTADQFQSNSDHRFWVSALHGFDPKTGRAILQVGEGSQPRNAFASSTISYSWRSWDLVNNSEITLLQKCESPFDSYDKNGSEQA